MHCAKPCTKVLVLRLAWPRREAVAAPRCCCCCFCGAAVQAAHRACAAGTAAVAAGPELELEPAHAVQAAAVAAACGVSDASAVQPGVAAARQGVVVGVETVAGEAGHWLVAMPPGSAAASLPLQLLLLPASGESCRGRCCMVLACAVGGVLQAELSCQCLNWYAPLRMTSAPMSAGQRRRAGKVGT